ncbi:MAG: DNA polymerase III alpha subunit, partial [Saprospiraceae bacterium]
MYLNCHTHYSFRYGTISEEALLQLVAKNDIRKIALTDINNTSACLNFIRLAPKYGIKPIIGIDFRNGITQEYIGLAKNNEGFKELNDFLSYHSHEKLELPEEAPELPNAFIIYPFSKIAKKPNYKIRSNEYIGIKLSEINKLKFSNLPYGEEKFVLLHPISFLNKTGFNTHRLLRAIGQNTLLSKLPTDEQAPPDEIMLPPDELRERLNQHPRILFNTDQLLEQCEVTFDFSPERKPQNIKTYTNSFEDDFLLLKQECAKGLIYRYKKVTPAIQSRLKKEMDLIEKMGYVAFFLTNWDIVQYAKNRGYYHVGRGSGANSIVAYLLGITDVDPIDLDLYFERFMNLYRANPPDFDIDFSWRDREDMTQYIFDRFGQNNQVALLATYNTFQYNGAVREMGKVFGLPKHEIDNLSKGRVNVSSLDQLSQLT